MFPTFEPSYSLRGECPRVSPPSPRPLPYLVPPPASSLPRLAPFSLIEGANAFSWEATPECFHTSAGMGGYLVKHDRMCDPAHWVAIFYRFFIDLAIQKVITFSLPNYALNSPVWWVCFLLSKMSPKSFLFLM